MSGGALLADGNSYMYITESNFTSNVAEYGGAHLLNTVMLH